MRALLLLLRIFFAVCLRGALPVSFRPNPTIPVIFVGFGGVFYSRDHFARPQARNVYINLRRVRHGKVS